MLPEASSVRLACALSSVFAVELISIVWALSLSVPWGASIVTSAAAEIVIALLAVSIVMLLPPLASMISIFSAPAVSSRRIRCQLRDFTSRRL